VSASSGSRRALVVRGGWDGHVPEQATDRFLPYLKEIGFEVELSDTLEVYTDAGLLAATDLVVQCWTRAVRAQTTAGPLSVALLPQREFQRLPEDSDHAIVKHYLTPKNCAQKLNALREYGLI